MEFNDIHWEGVSMLALAAKRYVDGYQDFHFISLNYKEMGPLSQCRLLWWIVLTPVWIEGKFISIAGCHFNRTSGSPRKTITAISSNNDDYLTPIDYSADNFVSAGNFLIILGKLFSVL